MNSNYIYFVITIVIVLIVLLTIKKYISTRSMEHLDVQCTKDEHCKNDGRCVEQDGEKICVKASEDITTGSIVWNKDNITGVDIEKISKSNKEIM